jgi:outer membrane cobalamin receptor
LKIPRNINKYYHKLFVKLFLLIFPFTCFAQNQKLEGVVLDSITKQGLPYASVSVYQITDSSIISGAITDIEGKYEIQGLSKEMYKLESSYMGYHSATKIVDVKSAIEIVNFQLSPSMLTLNEVEIAGEKKWLETGIEKTSINVSKDISTTGGNALDVMLTIPSVDIDFDGNLQYRGSDKVMILINGKRSEIVKSLDQIPADRIEKVEIINNPSAKYDAEGMSGIINIVLKSGEQEVKKTSFMLNAGYPLSYGGNIGYSGSKKKLSFMLNAGYQHKTSSQIKEHYRDNYGIVNADNFYQYDYRDEIINSIFLTGDIDYNISDHHQIGFMVIGSGSIFGAEQNILYQTKTFDSFIFGESEKDIDSDFKNYSIDGNTFYIYKFRKKGQQLKASGSYSLLNADNLMYSKYFAVLNTNSPELQNTQLTQLNNESRFTLDYTHPFTDSLIIESGYHYSDRNVKNNFDTETYNYENSYWEYDNELSHTFSYLQKVHSAYINFKAKYTWADIQAGLRTELTNTIQNKDDSKHYFNWFPSISLSHRINDNLNMYVAYNRRINRPTIKMINPFTEEYADLLNMHRGNPELNPEYVNSVEAGTRYLKSDYSGMFSLYYRNISDAISRVKYAANDSALVVSYINLDFASLIGAEFSASVKANKYWTLTTGANVFQTRLTGEYQSNKVNNERLGWNFNLTNQFKFAKDFSIQITAYYRSKLPSVLGVYSERYYLDFAASKKLFKNQAQLIFKISDVFNTNIFGLDIDAVDENNMGYSQINRRKKSTRYFMLSFIFNLKNNESGKASQKNQFYLDEFDK